MRGRLVAAGVAALMVLGGTVAYGAAASQDVACTITDNTLTCPLPAPPAPVTETVTAAPVTVTAPAVTVTKTVTAAPTTSTPPATPTPTSSTPTTPTSTTATTATTAPAAGGFPDSTNTGVPAGTTLSAYTGPCTITTAGTVIDSKTITCPSLLVKAAGVKVTKSRINGIVQSDHSNTGSSTSSITIEDSYINGGNQETFPAVSYDSVTLTRVEVVGGQHSFQCNSNCVATDSYFHGQYLPASSSGHVNAFISNGGSGFTLTHNTFWCSVSQTTKDGGCSGDVSFFGDFSKINNVTVDNNLMHSTGGSFCLFAGNEPSKPFPVASNVKITNNVFQRGTVNGQRGKTCGYYGPVTSYSAGNGNVFTGNKYDDGTIINP